LNTHIVTTEGETNNYVFIRHNRSRGKIRRGVRVGKRGMQSPPKLESGNRGVEKGGGEERKRQQGKFEGIGKKKACLERVFRGGTGNPACNRKKVYTTAVTHKKESI